MKMKKAISILLSIIMIAGAMPVISFAEADVETGLIAYYSFEEDSKNPNVIKDMSGNGNDAIVLNNINTDSGINNVISVSGGVATFPGMTLAGSRAVKGAALKLKNDFNKKADSFTYSVWINADSSYIYADKLARLFDFANMGSTGTDKTNSIFARYTTSSGLLYIRDRKLNNVHQETTLSDKPFTDTWGLFTFVYEKNESTGYYETDVYVNGEIVPELSTTNKYTRGLKDLGELNDTSNGMFIGRTTWGQVDTLASDPDFKGQMDEIRIYNRALTPEDISYLYLNTSPIGKIKMESFYVDEIRTIAGNYPNLPQTVRVRYNTGTEIDESVVWDEIPQELLEEKGVITVKGVTGKGNSVSVTVTVLAKDTSPLSVGLVAYYSFDTDEDEPELITDDSGSSNNGMVYNINTNGVSKKLTVKDGIVYFPGSSVSEDHNMSGNSYFNGPAFKMPDDINEGIEEFTYSAWIYADTDYRYANGLQRFFDFGVGDRDSFFYRYVPQTGESRFQDRGLSYDSPTSLVDATLSDKPFNDEWAHLAVTYKKGNDGCFVPAIYINGKKETAYDTSLTKMTRAFEDIGSASGRSYGFWIGRTQWWSNTAEQKNNPEFKGMMDEIRLYDRVLDESEIEELYNKFKPGNVVNDTPIEVKRVDTLGNVISTSMVYGALGKSYTYPLRDGLVVYNNYFYEAQTDLSILTIDSVAEGDTITVVYDKAKNLTSEELKVKTYVRKEPSLPKNIEIKGENYSGRFEVDWDEIRTEEYSFAGSFTATGEIKGVDGIVTVTVFVFPNYNNNLGGDLTITFYKDGEAAETKRIEKAYGSTFTLTEDYRTYFGDMYDFTKAEGSVTQIGESIVMDELGQHIDLYYTITEKLFSELDVRVKADDFEGTSYSLLVEASVLNTQLEDETVKLIIAYANDEGEIIDVVIESEVAPSRTGERAEFSKKIPFDKEKMGSGRVYLWTDSLEAIEKELEIENIKPEGYLGREVEAMMPTYEGAVDVLKKANTYWQGRVAYNHGGGGHASFWDTAAYHTGNMEYFKLTGDASFLPYSVNWANYNEWMGNTYTGEKSSWTWSYTGDRGSTGVLFGDWQTCFQTYIDLCNFNEQRLYDIPTANLDRVMEVMDYQISTDRDNYWWWADGIYMVMPVLSKLYVRTGDEKYLDAMTKYFIYAKELMYDGPGGIPTSSEGYTTSASLKNGAGYADPEDYKHLFYRDANYVYPLNAVNGGKNFWARGNGWVFAALSKVLSDMPRDYENYDVFYTTFTEMAQGIVACQEVDEEGYGFWTQSMTQDYPKSSSNTEGYETSGTAFMTYGLLWGINNGILDEKIYLEPALRGWGYLENVALSEDGRVGYVQPIGSAATTATGKSSTYNFGVGAFLLAGCEAARWADNH